MKKLILLVALLFLAPISLGFTSDGIQYEATAYSLRGRTASGTYVHQGIVAADTRLHKLGSYVYVSAGPYSGTYLVADTGRKIKGRRLDLWMPTNLQARQFGRRKVFVKALVR